VPATGACARNCVLDLLLRSAFPRSHRTLTASLCFAQCPREWILHASFVSNVPCEDMWRSTRPDPSSTTHLIVHTHACSWHLDAVVSVSRLNLASDDFAFVGQIHFETNCGNLVSQLHVTKYHGVKINAVVLDPGIHSTDPVLKKHNWPVGLRGFAMPARPT
jgi:hypothetical protein